MKRNLILLFVVICLLTAAGRAFSASPENSAYLGEISGSGAPDSLFSIHIDSDILSKCAPGCPDLRLYSAKSREIPYALIESKSKQPLAITSYELKALEYSENKDGSSTVIFKAPEGAIAINAMEISSANRNFKKAATLLGSNDRLSWKFIANGAFYDFSSKLDLRNTRLEWTTPSNYAYYKLSLADSSAGKDKEPSITLTYKELSFSTETVAANNLRIDKISVFSKPTNVPKSFDFMMVSGFSSMQDEAGNTVIIFKPHVPIETISFDVMWPAYYYRNVKIYSTDSTKPENFSLNSSTAIYNFPLFEGQSTQKSVPLNGLWRRYLKIVIENGDNPPLSINALRVGWTGRNLYFFADSPSFTYKFGVGGEGFKKPVYETEKMINSDNIDSLHPIELELSTLTKNTAYSAITPAAAFRESYEKTILTVIIAILLIVITGWIYRIIKHSNPRS
ncbi:MAG: hypothetical protein OEV59_05005 [Deltaproteobacteria bacterium]|nr:hypothetical protein [Deltaproteobacteria bacterium]